MKKILLIIATSLALFCFLALGVSAASTNDFGEVEELSNIVMTNMCTDREARMVIKTADNEYHTFPSSYIFSNTSQLQLNFNPITTALSETISKSSVIRLEVPSNISSIAYGGLSGFPNILEIRFLEDSTLTTVAGGGFYNNPLLEKINLPASLTEFTGTQIFNMCYALHTVTFAEDIKLEAIPDSCFQNCKSLKKLVLPHSIKKLGSRLFDSSTVIEELYLSPNLEDFGIEHFAWKQSGVLKIFAPAQLFASKDSVGILDFSWWNNDKCLPSMVIFLTGTEAQANAIVEKSTYHKLTNATVSKWDSGKTTDDYVPELGWAIVYDYGFCDAFFEGQHQISDSETVNVTDFYSQINIGKLCTRQGCIQGVVTKTIAPIFTYLGISTSTYTDNDGKYSVSVCYKIDREAYGEYISYSALSYGLVASALSVTGNQPLKVVNGQVVAQNSEKAYVTVQDKLQHEYVVLKVSGISATQNGAKLILSLFVFDGESIYYLNEHNQGKSADPVAVNVG